MIKEQRIQWMKEAKFGMFIHWGLYSSLGGEWNGTTALYIAEWIMLRLKIPLAEYRQIADKFNPAGFNAAEWVAVAKNAGMKYIVITAKHHEGFAMFNSRASKYNIVDATPYKKDPVKEIATECQKQGIKLCFYYSHVQDWEDKNAIGNTWDFPDEPRDFDKYLREKVKPQLRELLTQYGKVGIIWFDTPVNISREHAQELVDYVHKLQPECIVNNRVGHDLGDYNGFGDNEAPVKGLEACWETCATLNDTWGYKKNDDNWKSSSTIIKLLVDIVSKGGVYLLNVGPDGMGLIPEPSKKILSEVGSWLKKNSEAIYNTNASPFEKEFDWGSITVKPGKIYAHLFDWPDGDYVLRGLKNNVNKAYLVGSADEPLKLKQVYNKAMNFHELSVALPRDVPVKDLSVLVLEIDGEVKVDNTLIQQPDNQIVCEAFRADLHRAEQVSDNDLISGSEDNDDLISRVEIEKKKNNGGFYLSNAGVIEDWQDTREWLSWDIKVTNPGEFFIEVISLIQKPYAWLGETIGRWEGGHILSIGIADQKVEFTIEEGERMENSRSIYYKRMRSTDNSKIIKIDRPGNYSLKIKPIKLNFKELGLKLQKVILHNCKT